MDGGRQVPGPPRPGADGGAADASRRRGLSVVIPAFNERSRLAPTLDAVIAFLKGSSWDAEILVVDDGSADGTAALARSSLEGSGIVHQVLTGRANRGKGYSVREGGKLAGRAWTLVTDADLSTPISEVEKLWEIAQSGAFDLVIGSRALAESRIGVRQSWARMNMGRAFNLLVRRLTGLELKDTQCGFKLWRTARLRPVLERLRIDGFAYDVELLVEARRAGLTVAEVPVEWNDVRGSKVGMLADSMRMLGELIRIRVRR